MPLPEPTVRDTPAPLTDPPVAVAADAGSVPPGRPAASPDAGFIPWILRLVERALRWIIDEWLILLVGVFGLLLMAKSLWIASHLNPHLPRLLQLPDYFVEHLGAVLLVGMLVRVALEEKFQKGFLEDVQRGVVESITVTSKQVLTRNLSPLTEAVDEAKSQMNQLNAALTYKIIEKLEPNLRKVLEEDVLNAPWERPEYMLHLSMKPWASDLPEAADILEVRVTTTYTVTNKINQVADYPCKGWLDDVIRPAGKRECRFTRFVYGSIDEKNQVHFIPAASIEGLEAEKKIYQEGGTLRLACDIEGIRPNQTYKVIVEGVQLMRRHDVFIWNVVTRTNSMDLTVDLEGGLTCDQLEIFPRALHHAQEDAVLGPPDDSAQSKTQRTLRLNQVFLPYQGVEIRWSPRVVPKAADAAPSPTQTPASA